MAVKATKLTVSLPFGIGKIELENDETQQRAAWSLYVELMTRVAVQPLDPDHGLMREVLNSLYTLFGQTRQILREAGPVVATRGDSSFGSIAIRVLNEGIRPFSSKWHPKLLAYEKTRPETKGEFEHEQEWAQFEAECVKGLQQLP